jgi:curved DNA-binding protein CbpA
MTVIPDYYAILGVHPSAEGDVITAAFKTLAKKYHPDTARSSSSSARFIEVQEAYDVLRDPIRRKNYDEEVARSKTSERTSDREDTDYSHLSLGQANKRSYVFFAVVAALFVTSAVVILGVAIAVRKTDGAAEIAVKGSDNSNAKTILTDEVEMVTSPSASEGSNEGSQQSIRRRKQIYDRVVNDEEVTGEVPRIANGEETQSDGNIYYKNDEPTPKIIDLDADGLPVNPF